MSAYEAATTSTRQPQQSQSNGPTNAVAGMVEASAWSHDDLIVVLTAANSLLLLVWLLLEVSN
jgi:hypothetical protein